MMKIMLALKSGVPMRDAIIPNLPTRKISQVFDLTDRSTYRDWQPRVKMENVANIPVHKRFKRF